MLQISNYDKMRNFLPLSYRLSPVNYIPFSASRLTKRNIHYTGSNKQVLVLCKSSTTCYISYSNNFQLSDSKRFSITPVLAKGKNKKTKPKGDKKLPKPTDDIIQALDVEKLKSKYDKGLEYLKNNFLRHLSLRTTVGALEDMRVQFNEKEYKLQELAQFNRKPKLVTLNVSAFSSAIPNILDTLRKSHMNLNPQREGNVIYVPIPVVTKEYKENLLKTGGMYVSKFRKNATEIRNKHASEMEKKLTKDLYYKVEAYLNDLNQYYIVTAEEMLEAKRKEFSENS